MLESKPTIQQISNDAIQLGKQIHTSERATIFHGTWYGQDIAVKRFDKTKQRGNFEQSFQKTMEATGKYRFPTIINYYGVSLNANDYAMVMEWMPKGSLNDVLHNPSEIFAWNPVRWQIAIDTAAGLSYLHEQGAVHGDLSSFSIMLDMNYRAKLTLNSKEGLGAVRWRAPELFKRGATTNPVSEIYSFGMILWEITTRSKPYASDEDDAAVGSYIKDNDKETIPETSPKAFADSINACWNEIDKRPVASQILKWLSEAKPAVELQEEKIVEPKVELTSAPASVPTLETIEKTPIVSRLNPQQLAYIEKLIPMLFKAISSQEYELRNAAKDVLIQMKNLIPKPLMFDVIDTLVNIMIDENNRLIGTKYEAEEVLGEFADKINLLQTPHIEKLLPRLLKAFTSQKRGMRNAATNVLSHIGNLVPESLMFDVIDTLVNTMTNENNDIVDTAARLLGELVDNIPKNIQAKVLRVVINTISTKHQSNRRDYHTEPTYTYSGELTTKSIPYNINDKILENLALTVAKLKGIIPDDYKQLVATTILTCIPKKTEIFYLEKIWPNRRDLIDVLLLLIANKDPNNLIAMDILTSLKDYAQFFVPELDIFSHTTQGFHLYRKVNPNTKAEEIFASIVYGIINWHNDASGERIAFDIYNEDIHKEILNLSRLAAAKNSLVLLEGLHPVQEPLETYFNEGLVELIKSNCDSKQLQDRSSLRKKSHDILTVLLALLTTSEDQVREKVAKTLCDLKEIIPVSKSVEIIQRLVNEENFFVDEAVILQQYFRNLPEIRTMALERRIVQVAQTAISTFKTEETEKISPGFFKKYTVALIRFKTEIPEAQHKEIIDTLVMLLKESALFDESICEAILGLKEYIPASFRSELFDTLMDIIKSRQYKNLQYISMIIAEFQDLIPETTKHSVIDVDVLLSAIKIEDEESQQDAIKSLGILINFMTNEQRILLVDELLNKMNSLYKRNTRVISSIFHALDQCYGFVSDELGLKIVEELMENIGDNHTVNEHTVDYYTIESLIKFKVIIPDNLKEKIFFKLLNTIKEKYHFNVEQRIHYFTAMIELSTALSQARELPITKVFDDLIQNKYYWKAIFLLNHLVKLKNQSKVDIKIDIDWNFIENITIALINCRMGLNKEALRSIMHYVITLLIAVMQQELDEDDREFQPLANITYFLKEDYVFEEPGNLLTDTQPTLVIASLMDKIKTACNIQYVNLLLTLKKSFSEQEQDTLWKYFVTILQDESHFIYYEQMYEEHMDIFVDASKVLLEIKRQEMLQFLFNQIKQNFDIQLVNFLLKRDNFLSDAEKQQLATILIENFSTGIKNDWKMTNRLDKLSVNIIQIVLQPVLHALQNPAHTVRHAAIKAATKMLAESKKINTRSLRQIIDSFLIVSMLDENEAICNDAAYALAQFKDLIPTDMHAQYNSSIYKIWHVLNQNTKLMFIKKFIALNPSSPVLIKRFFELDISKKEVPAEIKEVLSLSGINDSETIECLHKNMMTSNSNTAVFLLGYTTVQLPEVVILDLFETLGKYPSASFALGRASRYQPDIIDKLFEKLNEKDLKPDVMAIILQALSIGLQAMVTVVQDKQDSQAHGNNRNLLLAQPTSNLNPENPSLSSALGMRMNN